MKEKLRTFIQDELVSEKIAIQYDDNLLLAGIIDSLGFIKMIQWIEKEYAVTIPARDILIENFMSLNAVENYLKTQINE